VLYRRLASTVAGKPMSELRLSYRAPRPGRPATGPALCAGVFSPPVPGITGRKGPLRAKATWISYATRQWGTEATSTTGAWLIGAVQLKACLAAGYWRRAGRGHLDGKPVIKLVLPAGGSTLWLDAATYLPVRLASTPGYGWGVHLHLQIPPPDQGQPGPAHPGHTGRLHQERLNRRPALPAG
jgi:hypothetical protein